MNGKIVVDMTGHLIANLRNSDIGQWNDCNMLEAPVQKAYDIKNSCILAVSLNIVINWSNIVIGREKN